METMSQDNFQNLEEEKEKFSLKTLRNCTHKTLHMIKSFQILAQTGNLGAYEVPSISDLKTGSAKWILRVLNKKNRALGRRKWWVGRVQKEEGEGTGNGFDQNTLDTCVKL